jgi:hypothetical protein
MIMYASTEVRVGVIQSYLFLVHVVDSPLQADVTYRACLEKVASTAIHAAESKRFGVT